MLGATAQAHETDQYTLPLGRSFAELGGWFTTAFHAELTAAVDDVNAEILTLIAQGRVEDAAPLQTGAEIADRVHSRLFARFTTNEVIDSVLMDDEFPTGAPGRLTSYRPERGLYDDYRLLLDLTKLNRVFLRASTVKINGVLVGTDKLVHFINLGHIYHAHFVDQLARGRTPHQAQQEAVLLSAGSHPLLSEGGYFGLLSTGVWSNADLAANFAGLVFYRNLYHPVRWNDRELPPIVVRHGPTWALDDGIGPTSDFFVRFVTPHWNEALNPNRYATLTHDIVRHRIHARCPDLRDWYRDARGERRAQAEFAAISDALATYFGQPYGWRDDGEDTVSIARVCFDGAPSDATGASVPRWARDPLTWAVRVRDWSQIHALLREGVDIDAADHDGETALHVAVRDGNRSLAAVLLRAGADPNHRARYDTTPLHLATESGRDDLVDLLLRYGGDPTAADVFGRPAVPTP